MSNEKQELSSCCNAPVVTAHGCDDDMEHFGKPCTCGNRNGITMWFECSKCKRPADTVQDTVQDKVQDEGVVETSIKKKNYSLDDWRYSKDIIERTVGFISNLSPHNLWKGDGAIRNLLTQRDIELKEKIEELKGVYVFPDDIKKLVDEFNKRNRD